MPAVILPASAAEAAAGRGLKCVPRCHARAGRSSHSIGSDNDGRIGIMTGGEQAMTTTRTSHRILVLGAGYAGMMAALRTAGRTRRYGAEVTLVNASES